MTHRYVRPVDWPHNPDCAICGRPEVSAMHPLTPPPPPRRRRRRPWGWWCWWAAVTAAAGWGLWEALT